MTRPLQGFGLGLRPEYYENALAADCPVDWFEIISENYMIDGGRPLHVLDEVAERYPLAMHGVSLSIGGRDPLDRDYLRKLSALERRVRPALVSDHLCWTGGDGIQLHDLLPLPQTDDAVRHVAARVRQVQDALGRQILLENVSSYLRFADNTLDEAQFLAAIVAESGCGLLLDVNNIYVNGHNHGVDPYAMLDALPVDAAKQLHLAGHTSDTQGSGLLIDTHDQPVCEAVWHLYAHAVRRFGDVPAMIERDDNYPPFSELLDELSRARAIAESAPAMQRKEAA
ncbi:DUF692 domain-containing protein [Solilutibacter silvestris]|uniref:UPF0276 protein Lysil_1325 n=1 Tax=Solilutibacter silvestris TaxID=1645665 RepID=A0A2K1Q3S4_9GAMM|nr:DUF692 domain-containing protein [Lysobacter silvestris]PNS09696.1 hypothetical protein Lysil_1325 [Lysobacter silvestris]